MKFEIQNQLTFIREFISQTGEQSVNRLVRRGDFLSHQRLIYPHGEDLWCKGKLEPAYKSSSRFEPIEYVIASGYRAFREVVGLGSAWDDCIETAELYHIIADAVISKDTPTRAAKYLCEDTVEALRVINQSRFFPQLLSKLTSVLGKRDLELVYDYRALMIFVYQWGLVASEITFDWDEENKNIIGFTIPDQWAHCCSDSDYTLFGELLAAIHLGLLDGVRA